jgi:hypothetical protein
MILASPIEVSASFKVASTDHRRDRPRLTKRLYRALRRFDCRWIDSLIFTFIFALRGIQKGLMQ